MVWINHHLTSSLVSLPSKFSTCFYPFLTPVEPLKPINFHCHHSFAFSGRSCGTFADSLYWLYDRFLFCIFIFQDLFFPVSGYKAASVFPDEEHWQVRQKTSKKNPCVVLHNDMFSNFEYSKMWLLGNMVGLPWVLKDWDFFPRNWAALSPVSRGGVILWFHSICSLYIWIHDLNMPPHPKHQPTPSAQL